MNPLVSIITPCYNGEKFVHRLLDSVLEQTYSNIEFIFVNDGSTDQTESVVQSYKDKFKNAGISFIYIYQGNRGQAAALNQGLKIFKGKYLTWPDSDDYLTKDAITCRVDFLENHPEYKMVRGNGIYIHEKSLKAMRRISNDESRFGEDIFEDLYLDKTYNCCGCYMIEAKTFFGIYPSRQIYESREGQNWQMLIPISSISKCGYIDKDLYCVLVREESHHMKRRTYKEQLDRDDELQTILFDALRHSECDYQECSKLVREKYARRRMQLALKYHDTEAVKEAYQYLNGKGHISGADKRIYFWGRNKMASRIYDLVILPVRVYKRMRRMLEK